jgi:hypothetical protein
VTARLAQADTAGPTLLRLMARRGDLYENRVTGERAVVLRGDVDGGGLSGLVHLTVRPRGAVVGEHVRPAMDREGRALGAVARRRGLRATYPELLAPHGAVEPEPEILAAAGLA